jgi:Tripartite tricarboxylate transporter TctB family
VAEEHRRRPSRADLVAGVVFLAFGLAFAIGGRRYDVGSLLDMGPGYLPLALGLLLAAIGLGVVVKAFVAPDDGDGGVSTGSTGGVSTGSTGGVSTGSTGGVSTGSTYGVPPGSTGGVLTGIRWRAVGLVALAVVFFALTVDGLGFLPAVFVTAVIASLARRETTIVQAVLIAAGLTVASHVIFVMLLQLRLSLVGDWLGG